VSGSTTRRLIARDIRRHAGRLAVGSVGVALAVGIAAFAVGLGEGVRRTVLGEIFPLDLLEVTPETMELDLFALRLGIGSDTLDPEVVQRLATLPGVRAASPRMIVEAPVVASGGLALVGTRLTTELAVDGIEPAVLESELADAGFEDPGPPGAKPCVVDGDCGPDEWCAPGADAAQPVCRPVVPALASRQLVALFNTSLRRSWGLPRVNPDALVGTTLELRIGASTLGLARRARVIEERVRLVGFSDRAMPLGLTLPYGVVERLNARLGGASRPHGAVLTLADRSDAPEVMRDIRAQGLEVRDRGAQRAASVIGVLRMAAAALAIGLLAVAAVGVMHAVATTLDARRREIAVLRAVGVGRGSVRAALLVEAAITGAVAAAVGVALAFAGGQVADRVVAWWLPDLPYRPQQLVVLPPWLVVAALSAGAVAAVAGAWWPVRRAIRVDPAEGVRPR